MKTTQFKFTEGRGKCLRGFSDPSQIVLGALVKLEHDVPFIARGEQYFGNVEGKIVSINKSQVIVEACGNQYQVHKKFL